jgi:hypothetical protein
MTEAEWLVCDNPDLMGCQIRGRGSSRKGRLFACACCRRIWHFLTDARSREAVETAERYADRQVKQSALNEARSAAKEAIPKGLLGSHPRLHAARAAWFCSVGRARAAAAAHVARLAAWEEVKAQVVLLRCLLDNPFRPVALDPAWLTATVKALALAAYEERRLPSGALDPDRLAILADALEDAGCAEAVILSHLRDRATVHVRGCWCVDLLLDKE